MTQTAADRQRDIEDRALLAALAAADTVQYTITGRRYKLESEDDIRAYAYLSKLFLILPDVIETLKAASTGETVEPDRIGRIRDAAEVIRHEPKPVKMVSTNICISDFYSKRGTAAAFRAAADVLDERAGKKKEAAR